MSGNASPGRPTDRLFFAVYPDAAALARIVTLAGRLRAEHRLTGRPFAPERLHVTLAMAGDHVGLPDETLARATAVGAAIAAASFDLGFDRATAFPRPANRPCVLLAGTGAEALEALHAALEARLLEAGLVTRPERRYRPHLTLQYDDRGLPDAAIEPVEWTVRDFVLVRSLLGRGRHVALARWPLHG